MSIRAKLDEIANNLWWAWTPRAQALYETIDPDLWSGSAHNPVAVLASKNDDELDEIFADAELRGEVDSVLDLLRAYLSAEGTWTGRHAPSVKDGLVAYFCAEFGMHESLPIYSGGLGVLAGDHIKTASDLGIPFVGVGLLYPEGYFAQAIDGTGWQQESYPSTDWNQTPAERVIVDGEPLKFCLKIADRDLWVGAWKIDVGRSTLYLLDTHDERNFEEDRSIAGRLYSGDDRMRISQEIVLGIGAVRLLRALGHEPSVYHLNEGHCAFAVLELVRERMAAGESYEDALSAVRGHTLLTTHTPVPAGHDRFSPDLVRSYLAGMQQEMGIDWDTILGLGRVNTDDHNEPFCMTVIAMKGANRINGVSALHGEVTRDMWKGLFPDENERKARIGHVTNGVHIETFMHPLVRVQFDERFGERWADELLDQERWNEMVDSFSDDEIVRTKMQLKQLLFDFLQRRHASCDSGDEPQAWSGARAAHWRQDALTIGFARRFATYKRGAMFFEDFERAARIIADADRPVQIVFAGKAHPRDIPGKEIIRRVLHSAADERILNHIIFVENYDLRVARSLVAGVDVWLNTPRRPREASGTSGQKIAVHFGLNASILDGWWAEGYDGNNGFAIGDRVSPMDPAIQDRRDSEFLYQTFENQIVPSYYAAPGAGRSPVWVARMRTALRDLPTEFSSRRMVRDYVMNYYGPIARRE